MNDFTKDELLMLYEYIDNACTEFQEPDEAYVLLDKVRSLIDNYTVPQITPLSRENLGSNIMEPEERERKFKIYHEQILPQYGDDPDKVPPYLEPDFNEGWR